MADDSVASDKAPENEGGDSGKVVFLHGELDICIIEAKSLPNMDLASERMRKCFTMFGPCGSPSEAKSKSSGRHSGRHSIITSDPYVSVCLGGATVAQTRVIANSENPLWDEHFRVPVAHPVKKVQFEVKDNDLLGAQLIGVVEICADKISLGNTINGWFPIVGSYGNPLKPFPELHFSVQFFPFGENSLHKDGVGAGPDHVGVPNTYFPLRKGGSVTLYQDAHVPDAMLPEILLDGGKVFQQNKCWEDICHAILEAHHVIYIVGWSVFHRVKLVREPTRPLPPGGELCLGDLLKYKSQEGVRVVLLIWDDKTSHDKFLLKTISKKKKKNLSETSPISTFAGGQYSLNFTDVSGTVHIGSGWPNTKVSSSVYSPDPIAIYQVDKVLLPEAIFGTDIPPTPAPAPAPDIDPAARIVPTVHTNSFRLTIIQPRSTYFFFFCSPGPNNQLCGVSSSGLDSAALSNSSPQLPLHTALL
ncbi:hypothetical protein HYC85_009927 [Camellia sinensis]|uniref:C2 domain-containing protein n=1 Tax=Camellia sinensis TaxID=4442 RepID=A0A7J7HGK5_CAMSI|nr:hypothetical protein HYC85_009927 [Camellia sinensis]